MYICFKGLAVEKPYIKYTNKSVGVDLLKSWITRKMLKLKSGVNLASIPVLAILRELMVSSCRRLDGRGPATSWQ